MHTHVYSLNFTIQSEDADARDVTPEIIVEKINFLLEKYKGKGLMMFVDHLDSRPARNAS
jgi:hypothetical protein